MSNSYSNSCRACSSPVRTAACAFVMAIGVSSSAQAQFGLGGIVLDPSNLARNVLHYARRLEQMNLQKQQLQQQVSAMKKLKNPNWRQINSTLDQINTLMRDGQALAYGLSSIDAEFRRTFPGTQVFQNYPSEQTTQSNRTLATLRGALNAASRATQDFPTSVARLNAIKQQLGSIGGHEEALELNGTIGMYSAEELTMLRQSIAALTNVQAVYYADQVNQRAQETATYRARLASMSAPGPHYSPMSLRITP